MSHRQPPSSQVGAADERFDHIIRCSFHNHLLNLTQTDRFSLPLTLGHSSNMGACLNRRHADYVVAAARNAGGSPRG
jgi:hypothetical protein